MRTTQERMTIYQNTILQCECHRTHSSIMTHGIMKNSTPSFKTNNFKIVIRQIWNNFGFIWMWNYIINEPLKNTYNCGFRYESLHWDSYKWFRVTATISWSSHTPLIRILRIWSLQLERKHSSALSDRAHHCHSPVPSKTVVSHLVGNDTCLFLHVRHFVIDCHRFFGSFLSFFL